MEISYRLLSAEDVDILKALLAVFAEVFEEPQTYQGAVPRDNYLASLLSRDNFLALVATDGTEVVGGLTAYLLDKYEQERKEVYIYDLAVLAAYRRRGIATRLIRHATAIARERGAWVVFVQADRGDAPAIRLYESLGKKEEILHFDIPVK